jgi:hypothetical protein
MGIPAVKEEYNLELYNVVTIEWEEYDSYKTKNLVENGIVEPHISNYN